MKKWLYSTVCFALLGIVFSCGPKKESNTDKTDDKTDSTKYFELPGKFYRGDSLFRADLDTLTQEQTRQITRYEIEVDKDKPIRFCGAVNKDTDQLSYKINIFFKKSWFGSKKMAMGRITGGDRFMYEFNPPEDGFIIITIEEERTLLGWRNLKLNSTSANPPSCCPGPIPLSLRIGRTNVTTTDSSSSGVTVKVEQ
jgi:hypothetical protein